MDVRARDRSQAEGKGKLDWKGAANAGHRPGGEGKGKHGCGISPRNGLHFAPDEVLGAGNQSRIETKRSFRTTRIYSALGIDATP